MPTKHELYQAHEAKDPFDIEPAILHLEQAEAWLKEALVLAREGTIESLLQYYETGYTSGNWHFPTIATHYAHGIGHRLAKMLEDELLTGSGFHFRYRTNGSQEWNLFYRGPDDVEEFVAGISIWTKELRLHINFEDKRKWLDERVSDRQRAVQKAVVQIDEQREWLRRYERNPLVRMFRVRRLRKLQSFAPEFFSNKKKYIESLEKDIENFRAAKIKYEALEKVIPVLRRFEKYQFTIHPAPSVHDERQIVDAQE